MLRLTQISKRIQQKNQKAFTQLINNLTNPFSSPTLVSQNTKQLNKSYVHVKNAQAEQYENRNRQVTQHKNIQRGNSSLGSLPHSNKIAIINKKTVPNNKISQKQMRMKREQLMLQLKQIDESIKNKKEQQHLQKIKKIRTKSQCDTYIYQKAAKLVEKMNRQRKQIMEKKVKNALCLKHSVEESIKKFKEMQEQKREDQVKRKMQIERRIEERKHKFYEMQKVNKMSNKIIKELKNYKLCLPDIYFNKIEESRQGQIMLTNPHAQNQSNVIDNQSSLSIKEQSRVSPFLQNIHQEELQRKRQNEKLKQYQKQIRQKQIEYGKKLRLNLKIRQRRLSQSKVE